MIILATARKRRDGEPVSETHLLFSGFGSDLEPDNFIEVISYADSNLRDLDSPKKYSCPKFITELVDVLKDNSVRPFETVQIAEAPDVEALHLIDHVYEMELDSATLTCVLFVDAKEVDLNPEFDPENIEAESEEISLELALRERDPLPESIGRDDRRVPRRENQTMWASGQPDESRNWGASTAPPKNQKMPTFD